MTPCDDYAAVLDMYKKKRKALHTRIAKIMQIPGNAKPSL